MTETRLYDTKARLIAVLAAAILIAAGGSAAAQNAGTRDGGTDENYIVRTVQTTVLVTDPDAASELIGSWAEENGGYYTYKSTESVRLRVPWQRIPALRELIDSISDRVVEYSENAQDLREEIGRLQAGIASREEVLGRNLTLLDRADVSGTLAIEQEVIRLIAEIERLKGRLRKLDTDRTFSAAVVSFRFLEPELPQNVPSSFPWINTVDFYRFMEEEP
jgi:hypothetical protein